VSSTFIPSFLEKGLPVRARPPVPTRAAPPAQLPREKPMIQKVQTSPSALKAYDHPSFFLPPLTTRLPSLQTACCVSSLPSYNDGPSLCPLTFNTPLLQFEFSTPPRLCAPHPRSRFGRALIISHANAGTCHIIFPPRGCCCSRPLFRYLLLHKHYSSCPFVSPTLGAFVRSNCSLSLLSGSQNFKGVAWAFFPRTRTTEFFVFSGLTRFNRGMVPS